MKDIRSFFRGGGSAEQSSRLDTTAQDGRGRGRSRGRGRASRYLLTPSTKCQPNDPVTSCCYSLPPGVVERHR